jgi:hypothetical protein
LIACLLAAAAATGQAAAAPGAAPGPAAGLVVSLCTGSARSSAAPPAPADTDEARVMVARRLVGLGRPRAEADAAAALLTPEDLAVLGANPRMLQEAGSSNTVTISIVVGCLLIAGIIVAASASGGTVIIDP